MNASKLRHHPVSFTLGLSVLASVMSLGACDSANTGPENSCPVGEKRCACFSNETCAKGLVCFADTCIEPDPSGTGGATSNATTAASTAGANTTTVQPPPEGTGGASPTATTSMPASSTGGSGNEATTATSSGGASSPASTTPSNGGTTQTVVIVTTVVQSGGSGNASSTTQAATGGTTQTPSTTTTSTSPANNSPIIDAFASCDDQIENNSGRHGTWYYFADDDFNATHGFGDPGTKWKDHGCAAWMILGCTGTACTYAGLGVELAAGDPVDLSRYAGVSMALEAGNDIYFSVKTSEGGYFGEWIPATTGNQTRNVDFADLAEMANSAVAVLNARLITELQFTIGRTLEVDAGFGMAIHSLSLR